MKVISVVGARAQFVKAAPVWRALEGRHESVLVHAGHRYDYEMPDAFFEQLGIPRPAYNLAVGAMSEGRSTGELLGLLEELFVEERPDVVLVYGDNGTTLAAGLASATLGVPVAHVEAGLRSYNRTMPEELNRVLVDHLSDLLLCPTRTAVANLGAEGITQGVHLVGDVMLDTARFFAERVDPGQTLERFEVERDGFYLATVHRAGTSDSPSRLASVIRAFERLDLPVLWVMHPKTAASVDAFGLGGVLADASNVTSVPALGYLDMTALLRGCRALLTDSGGMQKEAYFFGVPCVTLRDETEWVETVELQWNRLAGTDEEAIVSAVAAITHPAHRPDVYGDGHAAETIVRALDERYAG